MSVILQGRLGLELLVSELNFHLEVFFSVGHDVFDEIRFVSVAWNDVGFYSSSCF